MPRFVQGLIILLLCVEARAAVTCPPASSLRARVQGCEDNLAYAKAGKACLDSYEKEIEAEKGRVAKALSGLGGGAQGASLDSAKKGYEAALKKLKALAERGAALSKQVADFKNEVVLPEDFGSATAAGLPAETFLEGQSCYSETQKLIRQYSEIIALDAKQLALTGGIAAELAKKALRGEGALDTKDLLPLLEPPKSGARGKGAPEAGASKQKNGKSDITGTEKIKKK